MSPNPLAEGAAVVSAVSVAPAPLPPGKVYFEVALDGSLPVELRQKLTLAAYARIQEMDPDGLRGTWQRMDHVPNDPAKMPEFLRNQCLYPLGSTSRVQDCLVTHDDPPTTNYCYDETTAICYHPFTLVNPETGLPLEVHASHNGLEASAPILMVLAWESDPIFPAGAAFAEQSLARFEAREARTANDGAVTAWPDSFAAGRAAVPANGESGGKLRRAGSRSWIDFKAGDSLACDLGAGLAEDYTLLIVLRPGAGNGACDVFRTGAEDARVRVTMVREGATWTLRAAHTTIAGETALRVELPASDEYRVFSLQFGRENGICAFVDDERVPRQADFAARSGTGAGGEISIGCRAPSGDPKVSIGEVMLFRAPVWEEMRLAATRYLMNSYRS